MVVWQPWLFPPRQTKRSVYIYRAVSWRTHFGAKKINMKGRSIKVGAKVRIMAVHTLDELYEESVRGHAVSAAVGRRVNTTVARTGARINAHSDRNHQETRNIVHTEGEETRNTVHTEGEETRNMIRQINNYLEAPEIIIGFILGIISAIIMWGAEKDVVVKPVLDAAGNVTSYEPNVILLGVLSALVGIVVFDIAAYIVHAIRRRQ